MDRSAAAIAFLVVLSTPALGQLASGPAVGSISGGLAVSTEDFAESRWPGRLRKPTAARNKIPPQPSLPPQDVLTGTGPAGSNYFELSQETDGVPPITLLNVNGIGQTDFIPPDPQIAVGPSHIIQAVNATFRIMDKTGIVQKTIDAADWYSGSLSYASPFDPKVRYDHFAGRWIMVWLEAWEEIPQYGYSFIHLSISDDADPNGTWFNWLLPGDTNGNEQTSSWADYEGVGFDSLAYYITSNQYSYSEGDYVEVKLRIVPKVQLLGNDAGPVSWTDFWNLRDLDGHDTFGTRPVIVHGRTETYYLIGTPNFTIGTYFVLYRVVDPLGRPSISAVHIPVTTFLPAPPAQQLGSGPMPLESGGSRICSEPTYRDNSLWVVHAVASGKDYAYSAIRYVRLNTITNTAVEDVAAGIEGYWHLYPALAVDKDKNIVLTYSRSGLTQYAGAYLSWRLISDPPGILRPTVELQAGRGSYLKDFGQGRNRWGDYMGITTDPSDEHNIWMLTEYAAATNTWGVWASGVRLVPFHGVKINLSENLHDFGPVGTGESSDTVTIHLASVGTDPLMVNAIVNDDPAFALHELPVLPHTVSPLESISLRVTFGPTGHGSFVDTLRIFNNDPSAPESKVVLGGRGVSIGRAQQGVLYATSGSLYRVDPATGIATEVGLLRIGSLGGLAVHPVTNELYGTQAAGTASEIYRIAEPTGEGLLSFAIQAAELSGIAFTHADTAYAVSRSGELYEIILSRREATKVGTSDPRLDYAGLAIEPGTGRLWASVHGPPGVGSDRIYTIDRATGQANLIGATGQMSSTSGIAFGSDGVLYGISGSGTTSGNTLIEISTDSGQGSVIGTTGVFNITALAVNATGPGTTSIPEARKAEPGEITLLSNYPNPFNPRTTIGYALPHHVKVSLRVYNLLGEEVAILADGERSAGMFSVNWDASDLPSGVYFYRLTAGEYVQTRKMVLMK